MSKKPRPDRKWIRGGCRKCKANPALNHGRGLCGPCYGHEYDRDRIRQWPKISSRDLLPQPPKAQELPMAPLAPAAAAAPKAERVELVFAAADLPLHRSLVEDAKRNRRTLEAEILYRLDLKPPWLLQACPPVFSGGVVSVGGVTESPVGCGG